MKPFDEEAAKRGEKVEWNLRVAGELWVPVHYIGTSSCGNPVIERDGGDPFCTLTKSLRMAEKKKVTKWAVVHNDDFYESDTAAIRSLTTRSSLNYRVLPSVGYRVVPVEVEE